MFFRWNKKLNPLVAILSGLFIIVFGLIIAKKPYCPYFLAATFLILCLFGCWKQCFRILPMFIIVGGIFFLIAYLATNEYKLGISMANRFGALFLAMVPGMSTEPVAMTRSLSAVKAPRAITLGMLIAMSFVPMLTLEVKRVREAMKTRGAGSIFNPKIFYRALMLPFVMRLVNISDTLALSVETRGFTLTGNKYSIYHKPSFVLSDVLYISLLLVVGGLTIIL